MPLQCEKCDVIKVDIPHDGINMSFNKVYTESMEEDYFSSHWTGSEPSSGSVFNFVQDDEGYMAASLTDLTTGNVFQFHSTHDDGYAVTITPSSDFPPEDGPLDDDDEERMRRLRRINNDDPSFLSTVTQSNQSVAAPTMLDQIKKSLSEQEKRKVYDDAGSNLDVMVVWTKNAECNVYGLSNGCAVDNVSERNMRAMIDLAVFETNISYKNSNIPTEMLLAHAYRHPSYVESDFDTPLNDLQGAVEIGKGPLGDVKDKRSTYGADIVALIIDPGSSQKCGVALYGPAINRMVSITSWTCATGYYSFGHEIGHNLGCAHDRGQMDNCHVTDKYQYGWRDPTGRFRTVMGYACVTGQCDQHPGPASCPRIPYFSNPTTKYHGIPVGNALNDCARRINEVTAEVAAYYPHSITPSPVSPATPAPTRQPSSASCGNGICEIGGGEGCALCTQDCTPSNGNCSAATKRLQGGSNSGMYYGLAFDVVVKSRGLYFTMLNMVMAWPTTVKIYMKNGSYKSDRDLLNWTKVFDGSVTPNSGKRVYIRFPETRFYAPPGSTAAIYVSCGSARSIVYTNSAPENSDLVVLKGDLLDEQVTSVLPAVSKASYFFAEQIVYDIEPLSTPAPTTSRSAPTVATPAPTVATASPTTSTSAPSASTSAPTPCADKTEKWKIGKKTKNWCRWASKGGNAAKTATRCSVRSEIQKDCPVTCGLCAPPVYSPTSCVDRTDSWTIHSKTKFWCTWASKGTSTPAEIANKCAVKVIENDCPVTCGLCTP